MAPRTRHITLAAFVLGLGMARAIAAVPSGRSADNKIYAQDLVERTKSGFGLVWVGIHAKAPGADHYAIVAHTKDVIGKASDSNDAELITDGRTAIVPNSAQAKIAVMTPLRDASGTIVGLLALAFDYHPGDDESLIFSKAVAIRTQVAAQIPNATALFRDAGEAAMPVPSAYPEYAPQGRLSGELHCVGSDVMDTITLGWLEIFRKAHPQVASTIEARVASSAFSGLLSGQGQLGPISRPIFPSEVAEFTKKFGYPPTEIRVSCGTYDTPGFSPPLVMIVHPGNPLARISLGQIEEIYAEDGKVTSWDQLEITAESGGAQIVPWGLRPPNGTAFVFQQLAMHGRNFRTGMTLRPLAADLSRSAQRTPSGGVKAFSDIVAGVAADPLAIGYVAPGDVTPGVKVVPVAREEGAPAISPTADQVAAMAYPLSRFTYIYINRPPGKPVEPKVKEFLRIVLSKQGQAVIALRSPFLPLPSGILLQELAKLE